MKNFMDVTGMRVLPALISFMIFMVFAAPCSSSIINLGNIVGMALSAVGMAVSVFFKPFSSLVSKLWERTAGKAFICTFCGIAVLCVIAACVMSVFMVRTMNDRPDNNNTTVVVLGCRVKNGYPGRMLRKRLDASYDYLIKEPDVKVVVSGGQGKDESKSEAQAMFEYLTERGIAPDRIYKEDKSVNTEENLKFSMDIIKREKLPEKITLVTDGYHQLRAEMIADSLGIEAWNISAKTSTWLLPTYWVREWFGIAYYAVKK